MRWPPSARSATGAQSFLSILVPYQATVPVMPAMISRDRPIEYQR
jgi:hypothetical protein